MKKSSEVLAVKLHWTRCCPAWWRGGAEPNSCVVICVERDWIVIVLSFSNRILTLQLLTCASNNNNNNNLEFG